MSLNICNEDFINRKELLKIIEETNMSISGIRLGLGKIFLAEYIQKLREHYANIIQKIPPAEVVQPVHGIWVEVGKTDKGTPIRRCSCCGREKAGRPKSNFCPDCGCIMMKDDGLEGQQVILV